MPSRLHLSADSTEWTAEVSGARVTLTADDVPASGAAPAGVAVITVTRDNEHFRAESASGAASGAAVASGDDVWVTIDGEVFSFAVTRGGHRPRETRDHDAFTPPMSATVVRIAVKPGDRVHDGDVLIALEAMKMELPIRSPRDGVVRAIHCHVGELVQPDRQLIELE
jgi:biotin carboxyl carrier protein